MAITAVGPLTLQAMVSGGRLRPAVAAAVVTACITMVVAWVPASATVAATVCIFVACGLVASDKPNPPAGPGDFYGQLCLFSGSGLDGFFGLFAAVFEDEANDEGDDGENRESEDDHEPDGADDDIT